MSRLSDLIQQWTNGCQMAVEELKEHWNNNPQGCHMLATLLSSFNLDPADFDLELMAPEELSFPHAAENDQPPESIDE